MSIMIICGTKGAFIFLLFYCILQSINSSISVSILELLLFNNITKCGQRQLAQTVWRDTYCLALRAEGGQNAQRLTRPEAA